MNHKDEFGKWMKTIENAISGELPLDPSLNNQEHNECGCGDYHCQVCFPDDSIDEPMHGMHNGLDAQGELQASVPLMGEEEVDEAPEGDTPKPIKPAIKKKPSAFDDMDDLLNPAQSQPLANYDNNDDGEFNDVQDRPEDIPANPMSQLRRASSADTRARTGNITPSDEMRDWMSRIDPTAGGDEPEVRPELEMGTDLVARTASDVPVVISNALRASGTQSPEWHSVNDLPGMNNRNIRGMGRQVMGMFTRTPLEDIVTIANVQGQGPNTPAEINSVAAWLRDNGEDMGEVNLSHGRAIPGYKPDVREFRLRGVRFHVVRDQMGQYIYAYPDSDARTQGGAAQLQGNQPQGRNNMPQLRETPNPLRFSLMTELALDEIIREGLNSIKENVELDEWRAGSPRDPRKLSKEEQRLGSSSLNKVIGAFPGGQALIRLLHSHHKLDHAAELRPVPFNKELMWTAFKRNPDDFIIVSGSEGVAGIKPSKKHFIAKKAEIEKAGKEFNPEANSGRPYQIVAFKDNGEKIDSAALRVQPEPGEEADIVDPRDPTVMNARMGLSVGKDIQNANNTFANLAQQIGTLQTMWVSGWYSERKGKGKNAPEPERLPSTGSVPNELIAQRAEQRRSPVMPVAHAQAVVFDKIKPVLMQFTYRMLSEIDQDSDDLKAAGQRDRARQLAQSAETLSKFIKALDTSQGLDINSGNYAAKLVLGAFAKASGSEAATPEYAKFINAAAQGNSAALKPIFDALKAKMRSLGQYDMGYNE